MVLDCMGVGVAMVVHNLIPCAFTMAGAFYIGFKGIQFLFANLLKAFPRLEQALEHFRESLAAKP